MDLIIPEFLSHVKITKADIQQAAPKIKNWLRMFDIYKELDKQEIEKYMLIEVNYKQRKSVLDRLLGRYAKLVKAEMAEELTTVMGTEFRTGYITPVNEEIDRIIKENRNENIPA